MPRHVEVRPDFEAGGWERGCTDADLNGDPLPAVVAPLGVEQAVYVATWRTGTWSAVLSLTRDEHDDGRDAVLAGP